MNFRPWSLALLLLTLLAGACGSASEVSVADSAGEATTAIESVPTTGVDSLDEIQQSSDRGVATTLAPPDTEPVAPQSTEGEPTTTASPALVEEGILTGAAVLVADDFAQFEGLRIGLIAHQNSVVDGVHLSDWIDNSANVELVALFGPEHGVRGTADAGVGVDDAIDAATGAPIYSLYGNTRQPTSSMLDGIDVLFYDLQDVGTRYYTYISTMGLAMQAAAASDVSFVVLDRPNPLGDQVGGGLMLSENVSFVGQYEIPDVYGLTSGELARFIVDNNALDGLDTLDLTVVELVGWERAMAWEGTALDWIAPSPAIVSPEAALLYPATIYFEALNLSYGRGTEIAFQIVGAPWLDADEVASDLNARGLAGVRFTATVMTPQMLPDMTIAPAYLGETLPAVQLEVTDATAIQSAEVGVHLLEVVFTNAAQAGVDPVSRPEWMDQLAGSSLLRDELVAGTDAESIVDQQRASLAAVTAALEAARLYD